MDLWITEFQTPSLGITCKVLHTLRTEQTPYQHLAVVVTEQFGKMLLLDGIIMTTEADEFGYHEMLSQVALNSHPSPSKVLIIGGGDGGTLREAVNHPLVKECTLVEIDERVIIASKDYFPSFSSSFDHPKAKVVINDGIKYIKEHKDTFNVIIVDSTDPVGPAVELFSAGFYADCYEALKEDGMLVVQSESPFIDGAIVKQAYGGIKKSFPITKLYLANVPTYPSGLWSFSIGSKIYDPEVIRNPEPTIGRYYNPDLHGAAFKLPSYVKKMLEQV
ncbi:MAG: polyamine aminopropyltransferase [Syntrophomonadaceae bacterium]